MKQQDDRILEYLRSEGMSSPELIEREASIDISAGHIEERLLMLWYAGFVAQLWSDTYEITSEGRRYLRGELDAEHQPTPTVDRVLRGY